MKRLLSLATAALLAAALFATSAQAQSPHYTHRNVVVTTPAVVVYGGNNGYGNGYYGNSFGGYGNGYGGGYGNNYYGYAPVAPIYPRSAPYGAGYSGGYQPYQEMYLQRLYYGLGF